MSVKVDLSDFTRFDKELRKFGVKSLPIINARAINNMLFTIRDNYKENIKKSFTIRNKWIPGSVRVEKATRITQSGKIGSVNQSMELHEFGGTNRSEGGKNIPIASNFSSGDAKSARPRKKVVKKPNRVKNIKLRSKGFDNVAKSPKQALLLKVRAFLKNRKRNRFFYHDFQNSKGTKGIFTVVGIARKTDLDNRGWPSGARIAMIQDLSNKTAKIKKQPNLLKALNKSLKDVNDVWVTSMMGQIKKEKLFTSGRRR